ncbi:MAG TPA: hypothetical protein VFS88_07720 [Micavibrio sp.]|nr:hypothetical protein [Micavibrio sp.]
MIAVAIRAILINLLIGMIVSCFATSGMAQTSSITDRNIILARQLAQCSGAYYASSETVIGTKGDPETAEEFHEKGNGFLLATAQILTNAKQDDGFEAAYKRSEERAANIKFLWLGYIARVGDKGVLEINKVTKSCADSLGPKRDNILRLMRTQM